MITERSVLEQAGILLRKARWLETAASYPWCIGCQLRMNRWSRYSSDIPRWRCPVCKKTCKGASAQLHTRGDHREVRKLDKYNAAQKLFSEGYSIRHVARVLDIHKLTAAHYRKDCGEIRCKCGQDAKHRGFCWWRYQNSPKRQEFMKQWHSKAAA